MSGAAARTGNFNEKVRNIKKIIEIYGYRKKSKRYIE